MANMVYTQEELDAAHKDIQFYEEYIMETEILLEEIEENGPIPNLLMFICTKEGQINFYEDKLKRLRQTYNELVEKYY